MSSVHKDMTAVYTSTIARGAGARRWQTAAYVDLLPPCNHACPAGENIQAWLALAQAGRYREAWLKYMEENPLPGTHGRACYHPCESACNRQFLDAPVAIHSLDRFLGDLALEQGWTVPVGAPDAPRAVADSTVVLPSRTETFPAGPGGCPGRDSGVALERGCPGRTVASACEDQPVVAEVP